MNSPVNWLADNIRLPPSPYPAFLFTFLGLLITSEANSFHVGSALFKILASLSFLTAGISLLENNGHGNEPAEASLHSLATIIGLQFSFLGDIFLIPSPVTYYRTMSAVVATPRMHTGDVNSPTPEAGKGEGSEEIHEAATVRFKLGTAFFAVAHILYIISFLSNAAKEGPANSSVLETLTNIDTFRPQYFALSFTFCLLVADFLGILRDPRSGVQPILLIPNDLQTLVKVYMGIIATMVSLATATDNGWQRVVGAWMFMVSDLFVAMDVFGSKIPTFNSGRGRPGWKSRSVGWVLYFCAQMILAGTV